ncbi:putative serine/threonine protein kinase KKQ8 [Kluyveromyces lactis]|uniref:Probable serine/threonine-protein kinase HAL5-like n=1 Tax=Kluyveromyces lactis (strain ATCC 8585 / CBS 2359 / DSM 70799 / NBRC 1267 / NRRL Y-1140 / WM37) TaxID=284590 RepID=HAL5_KLULA|nr:uncharacterized protein KLLA0_A06820g [Kluyveromyces lactis]Q6CXN5.1 RecName: Full=Probable serine/threonine-protein kinase HAL5-like [Kluyveromyces lactis NRRL Y-1140]CAH02892.1 KLLA0A06820p [Kluyveromyces lactis]|eukprot:XP_451304.1 uncharacterized protein KLLA0_A06820g [Kluyveromyces lactis]
MASSNVDSSEPRISRESSLKRSLSISKSLKGLFKSGGGNANTGPTTAAAAAAPSSISTPEVPTLATKDKQDRLKNLAANKEKELQTSRRGVASPSLSPTRHVSLSNLAKLSLTSRAGTGQVDPNVIHETSPLASDEESTDLAFGKRQSSSNRSSSFSNEEQEPNNKYPLLEKLMGDLDEMVCGSIDTQLSKSPDTVEASSLRRSRSTQRKRLNSFSLRPRALSNPGQNPNHPVENRERSNTSSIDLLMSHESESRAIYKSDQFSVYPDGHHAHHLKVVPIVHDLEQSLNKPKSSFSFSGFFKTHRTIADDGENLATALSLLPANRFSFHKRLSQIIDEENGNHNADEELEHNGNNGVDSDSDADYDNQSSGNSNPSDDESESDEDGYKGPNKSANVPKIVNEKSVIGANELKLINQLTEKIDNGFCLKGSKSDAVSSNEPSSAPRKQHLCEKYGKSIGIIGQGAYGVVKLCYKFIDPDEPDLKDNTYFHDNKLFYAVKELKPRPDEPPKKFSTRLTSEFVIGLSLSGGNKSRRSSARTHPNILNVIDLMQTPNAFYEVMEFCPSGDLYSLITRSSKSDSVLHPLEADCFMKQLLHGIQYMHAHGVAHCDIKPENLLFLPTGVLKICDFGTSSVFQTAWEKKAHFQTGPAGSEPYVAPEEFIPKQQYDPRLVDCWSCGIIYCVMVLGHYLWKIAIKGKDSVYDAFLEDMEKHGQYYVFDEMKHVSPGMNRYRTAALYHIFQVDPNKRITVDSLLKSSWMKRTKCCVTYPPRPV